MKPVLLLIALIISATALSQANCALLKTGTFYYYPKKTLEKFVIIRDKSVQKEINLSSHDTTSWKIDWQSECAFTLKFIRGGKSQSAEAKEYYSSHILVSKITGVTKEYGLFTSDLDAANSKFAVSDTLWFSPKVSLTQN